MREWTNRHHVTRVDFAGVGKSARCGKVGQCRSGQISTVWQGWTLREWTMWHHVTRVDFVQEWIYRHDMARLDNAGVDNAAPFDRGGLCAGVDKSARCGKGGHCGSGQCRSGQIGCRCQCFPPMPSPGPSWIYRHHYQLMFSPDHYWNSCCATYFGSGLTSRPLDQFDWQ